jgi:protein TorT
MNPLLPKRFTIILIAIFLCVFKVSAEQKWYPYSVDVWKPPYNKDNLRETSSYIPLMKASGKWNLCVSFPHMKDIYWRSVNFGIVKEAKRFGISMRLYQANGYEYLNTQIEQIRNCVKEGVDGVIIGAISYDGLNELVSELLAADIPVIDIVNGMSSTEVSAKSLVSFGEMGFKAGEYIAKRHPDYTGEIRVAWFPGPKGAGWVEAGNSGFQKAIENSSINIIATRYGDTGITAQTELLEQVLAKHNDIDYVVGTAVTAQAAIKVIRKLDLRNQVKIMAYYLTPAVYKGIKRGQILAAPTDSAVIQGRIAIDQMVRILEKQVYDKHVGPKIFMLDKLNVKDFDRTTSFSPNGFKSTYTVNRLLR